MTPPDEVLVVLRRLATLLPPVGRERPRAEVPGPIFAGQYS